MGVEIRGLDRLKTKVGKLSIAVEEGAQNALYEMTEEVQGVAVSNLQSRVKYSTGELVGSVKTEIENDKGKLKAHVWSDKPWAMYREFGTGPVGEASEKKLPPGITPVYTQKAWFIPAKSVDIDLEAIYGIPKITIQEEEFYLTRGQPARPWLYPALLQVSERGDEIFKRNIQESIKKGLE